MAKFYIAGRVARKEEFQGYVESLEAAGHEVTSRWLGPNAEFPHHHGVHANRSDMSVEDRGRYAMRDLADVRRADACILFTEDTKAPGWVPTNGGRLVEFGYALARSKVCYVVGPQENLFACLPNVQHFKSWGGFFSAITLTTWYQDGLGNSTPRYEEGHKEEAAAQHS